jgi:hypothetical protein
MYTRLVEVLPPTSRTLTVARPPGWRRTNSRAVRSMARSAVLARTVVPRSAWGCTISKG